MNNTGQNVTDSLVAPYQPHVVILSYIYVVVVTILIFTNIALIIVRRNKQPVKIRSPQFIIFHLLSMWLIAMPLVIRLIVSRATFPCFIYTMVYCVAVPLGFLPFLIRIYRFVLVFRLSNMQLSKDVNAGKRIKVIKRLMSLRVMWSVSLILIFLHILLWAAVSGILTATEKFNFFSVSGCKAGKFVYVPIAILAIYAVVILVLLILLIRGVKEPYFIRAETITVVIIWLVILIQFGVCGSVPQFDDRIELNFPAGTLVFCGVFLDVLLTSIIPLIMTFQKKYNVGDTSTVNNDEILQILSSEQKRAELKDFAVRSVCAESIIFWEQIQDLKLISEENIRQETIIRLYDNFLVKDSPLELNVPMSKVTPVAEAIQAHTTSGATLSPNLFSELEDHCVTGCVSDRPFSMIFDDKNR